MYFLHHLLLEGVSIKHKLHSFNWLYGFVQVVTSILKVFPKDTEAPQGGVDDMTKLSYLHEPGVLQNLATRYELNEIYVGYSNSMFLFQDMMRN